MAYIVRRYRTIALSILGVALVASALCFLLPVVDPADNALGSRLRTAFAMALTVLYLSAAVWFMLALKTYRARLRVAYRLFGIGLIIFGVAMIQLPIIGVLDMTGIIDMWDSAWATGPGVILLFMLASILLHLGVRQQAKVLGLRTRLASTWTGVGVSTLVALVAAFVAQALLTYELEGADIYVACVAWTAALQLYAACLSVKIAKVIGAHYYAALRWQAISLFAISIANSIEALGSIFVAPGSLLQEYGLYLTTYVIAGFIFIKASYEFQLTTAKGTLADVGQDEAIVSLNDRDYLDSIVAVAALASRPDEIDRILDEVRIITAGVSEDAGLTEPQRKRIVEVYHKLEAYLSANDPLRTFDKKEVRDHVTPGFRSLLP